MPEESVEIRPLTDEEIVKMVNAEFDKAIGHPSGETSQERAKAWRYYLGKAEDELAPEHDNASSLVTHDVADVVDGVMPSLMRIFTTADNVVSFDAVGIEDEPAAEQESAYVSHLFFRRNEDSLEQLFFWMFDALLRKTGIIKCWWDKNEQISYDERTGLTEIEHLRILSDEEITIEKMETRQERVLDEQLGEVVEATVYDVTYKRTRQRGKVNFACVPTNEYRISNDANSMNPSRARMVGQEREVTRDELHEMGFPKELVNRLKPAEADRSSEVNAIKDKAEDRDTSPKMPGPDRSQDKFVLREAYQKMDANGDGRAELMQVFVVGDVLMEKSIADRQPFHTLCPKPLPHKHVGQSFADPVMSIQQISTYLVRGITENLARSNKPSHAVWADAMTETTREDLLTQEIGKIVEFDRPMQEAYAALTVPFTADKSFPMLEYFEKVKRDRTGINSDSEGLTPEALKNIQQSVLAAATDLSRMKIEMVARIFAETGFKSLFRHIRELVTKHQQKEDVFKLRNTYVPVKPNDWKERNDVTVNVGLGIGTREQNRVHLEDIRSLQRDMVEAGGMNLTVTPKNIYNLGAELVKNANFKTPEMFFTDPGDKTAPPPSDEQEELKKRELAVQERQQALDQRDGELKLMKMHLDARVAQIRADEKLDEIEIKRKKTDNDLRLGLEDIATRLTKIEVDSQQDIPGSKV